MRIEFTTDELKKLRNILMSEFYADLTTAKEATDDALIAVCIDSMTITKAIATKVEKKLGKTYLYDYDTELRRLKERNMSK